MEATLVRLQRREQHGLRHTFSRAIAARFYADGSLERRRRVLACTQRRQARLQERARLEAWKSELLRRALDEKRELDDKRREREMDRAMRRLQHMSAEVIQSAWRRVYHGMLWRRLRDNAACLLQLAWRDFVQRRKQRRFRATRRIQRWWRRAVVVLCVRRVWHTWQRVVTTRQNARCRARAWQEARAARCLQAQWRTYWQFIRDAAAMTLQRWARRKTRRQRVKRLASIYQHLQFLERMEASARRLQYVIGRHAARTRLRAVPTAAEKPRAVAAHEICVDGTREAELGRTTIRLRAEIARLEIEIARLRNDALPEAQAMRFDERERLRRLRVLEAQRLARESEANAQRKRDVEERKRREIRLELDKHWDLTRRQQGKGKGLEPSRPDSRFELV
ncbi:hypothetical protein SDRG_07890 [Saprolegnia diclina VS20]|uniref:Uncharacterized protein n=1 Tax=Saprolegnia diclina (strain VS20) TaxID=1156394 RepID=T0QL89_SAPDV|nr:hypothetical protein SDRG_07890 [Saprolegnia diclina VS20]EQC34565.1 hypothetical protein SDRG_07890 [Saprolegnia diclina VS20]|eukprot:XP_008611971.1 hypothetical protein SDRG_07890 [Saprolegnia diclina VS20]